MMLVEMLKKQTKTTLFLEQQNWKTEVFLDVTGKSIIWLLKNLINQQLKNPFRSKTQQTTDQRSHS